MTAPRWTWLLVTLMACGGGATEPAAPPAPAVEEAPAAPEAPAASSEADLAAAKAVVEALYAPYLVPDGAPPALENSDALSTGLKALFQSARAATPEGEVGPLDHDPVVDGQEYEVAKLALEAKRESEGKVTIDARFENLGTAVHVAYSLVKEEAGWKVDDLRLAEEGSQSVRDKLAAAGGQ